MNNIINKISQPIYEELKLFDDFFKKTLESDVKLINYVINYITRLKGKKIRPILSILCSKLSGEKCNQNTYLSASIVEILHVATLLHDDVVDESEIRRGWPTVHRIWKSKLSILVGDYMFSKALINTAELNDLKSIKELSLLSKRLSEGEILQIEKSYNKNMSEDTYFKMISDKTASLVSASCFFGFASVNKDEDLRMNIKEFGEILGICYQLKDDLFDITGNINDLGKPPSLDIKKNMLTLPYIYILDSLNDSNKRKLLKKLKNNAKKNDIDALRNVIVDHGGIDYTENKINELSAKAVSILDKFPDSEYKKSLIDIVEFNKSRNY